LLNKSIEALAGRRCILFDLGDTLWHRSNPDSWRRLEVTTNQRAVVLLRKYIPPKFLPNLDDEELGSRLHTAFNANARAFIQANPGLEANGPLIAIQTLQQWGIEDLHPDLGAALFEALRVRIPESRSLFQDTLSTLAALQQRGFLLGVVTNRLWGGKPFQEDLQTLGLLNYFDPPNIAISADLGIRKPNSAIFLHALNALSIPPEQAVMVGDSLTADIAGAQGLGIFSIWKPKPKLWNQIHNLSTSTTNSQPSLQEPEPPPLDPSVDTPATDALSLGMHITDDDYMQVQEEKYTTFLREYLEGKTRPDRIIQNLSELLDISKEVGVF
jgi:HAD superfamily hydrolase (TIGR01549 family)